MTDIVQVKSQEIERLHRATSERELILRAERVPPAHPFLPKNEIANELLVIAEVKKASPSKGSIQLTADPARVASAYDAGGADAISVLTDERFFSGSIADFLSVRNATQRPLLRKDFLLDEWQVYEARAMGADAILLIVAILSEERLRALQQLATELGMAALLEVHNREEADRLKAIAAPRHIGVNNRNLHTFQVDLHTTETLVPYLHSAYPDAVIISESGIAAVSDAARASAAGANGLLVGEALMRQGLAQVGTTIGAFKNAVNGSGGE